MKRVLVFIVMVLLVVGVQAQKKSVFDPVRVEDLRMDDAKAGYGTWFLRINTTLSATTAKLSFDEAGEFNGFESAFLSRIGFGPAYAHYIEKDGQAVNNYSINAFLLTPTEGFTNLAIASTFSMYNVNIGLGYDIIKDQPFKKNIFLMFGVQMTL
ncbi:MAG: hypothetical protein BWY95_00459 [Bacteroidetes bacterium ADurb.BinA104]|nr:MAG: hypothetical protein BWY95_00459 [Bacteroidetes bacterium ADurb.BinA104]HOC49368.1 hypothetical protein [Bacteroidales bacterium]